MPPKSNAVMNKEIIEAKRMQLYNRLERMLVSRFFHYIVLFFIVISIAAVIASSFKSMHPYRHLLFGVNYLSSFVFLVEYQLRIIAAPARYSGISALRARLKYLFSFYGLVDFVAVLPFLLVYLFKDSDSVHIITLAYIFIVFKLIRHSKSFQLIGKVLAAGRAELVTAYTACGIIICFAAILMYYIERGAQPEAFADIGDGFWWAIVAFTTVGYGDIYPITPLGKLLSSLISLIGIAMIAIPTGIISSSFINLMQQKNKKNNP